MAISEKLKIINTIFGRYNTRKKPAVLYSFESISGCRNERLNLKDKNTDVNSIVTIQKDEMKIWPVKVFTSGIDFLKLKKKSKSTVKVIIIRTTFIFNNRSFI